MGNQRDTKLTAAAADAEPCHGKGGFALVFHIFTASRTAPPSSSAVGTESVWHEDRSRAEECQAAAVVPDELSMVDFRDARFTWAPLALDLKHKAASKCPGATINDGENTRGLSNGRRTCCFL